VAILQSCSKVKQKEKKKRTEKMNKSFKEKKKIATEIGFSAMIRLTPSSYWHAVPCFLFIVIVIRYYFFFC